jgi:hypothetical protein
MLRIAVRYNNGSIYGGNIPDNGLTIWEWAHAVHAYAAGEPVTGDDQPGVEEIRAAFHAFSELAHPLPPLRPGDVVEVDGRRVTVESVTPGGRPPVVFTQPYSADMIDRPECMVAGNVPPPDGIAYVEDQRDRLWTGRGFGQWRCVTGGITGTYSPSWQQLWRDHGPLTPLVPARQQWPHRDGTPPLPRRDPARPVFPVNATGVQVGDNNSQVNHF